MFEIWLVVHRHERLQLWLRAPDIHAVRCRNGHELGVSAPLILFDPDCPFVICSPGTPGFDENERRVASALIEMLAAKIPPSEQQPRRVELVPRSMLRTALESPITNLGAMAPDTPPTDEALAICAAIRSGRIAIEQVRLWVDDVQLPETLRAGLRFELATCLGRRGATDRASLEAALVEWRVVQQLYPRASAPRRWALASAELAECYVIRREANRAANYAEAARLMNEALAVLTEERFPEDFALLQGSLSNLLMQADPAAPRIHESIRASEAALRVYTRESYPQSRALTLSNMATTFLSTGGDFGSDELRRALAMLDEALLFRSREQFPYDWAITQMHRGLLLSRLISSRAEVEWSLALEALRGAYETLKSLGDEAGSATAAFNLGTALNRFEESDLATEASDRLEEALPALLAQHRYQALAALANSYVAQLRGDIAQARADHICERAAALLAQQGDDDSLIGLSQEAGIWQLRNAPNDPERLKQAGKSFERVLARAHRSRHADIRAAALTNLATVLLLTRGEEPHAPRRARARDCLDEASRILRALPHTVEREEALGLIVMNRVQSELDDPDHD